MNEQGDRCTCGHTRFSHQAPEVCMVPDCPCERFVFNKYACRACGKPIMSNSGIADGCPCNSSRGINHGLVPTSVCTCKECDPAETGSVRPPTQPDTTR